MERLGRYPLSIILSFLNETEGTSLLITKKRYAYQLLPIFRLRHHEATDDACLLRVAVGGGSDGAVGDDAATTTGRRIRRRRHQNRHCFVPCPVQDPPVLLARLNTRRLYRRRRRKIPSPRAAAAVIGLSTAEIAAKEWQETDPTQWLAPELELLRFLDRDDELRKHTTLLVSYPRSGNTLVRTLLERTTGLVTGSDTRPDRRLSRQLAQQHNLVGEGLSSPTAGVALIKSHWPERSGNAMIQGHRVILVVRNPYDAIDSYWNMNATCSHTSTVTEQVYTQFQEMFHALVKNEIDVWLKFHYYWIEEQCGQQPHQVPLLVVRFEDLLNHTETELTRIVQFFLEGPQQGEEATNQGPALTAYWRNRIAHVVAGHHHSKDKLGSYQPRSASRTASNDGGAAAGVSLGKSLQRKRYSPELLQYIHRRASDASIHPINYLAEFGYDIFQQGFPANFSQGSNNNISSIGNKNGMAHKNGATTIASAGAMSCGNNTTCTKHTDAVSINVPGKQPNVRPIHCPFGRQLQAWRHSVTDNDTNPLPTE